MLIQKEEVPRAGQTCHYGQYVFLVRKKLYLRAKKERQSRNIQPVHELGVVPVSGLPFDSLMTNQQGKPDAGNPHVRFEEGEASRLRAGTSLLYSKNGESAVD